MANNSILRYLMLAVALVAAAGLARGEEPLSIVEDITADSVNVIIQPAALGERVIWHEPQDLNADRQADRRAGFRVQIFSGSNQGTARNTARSRNRLVSGRFPQYHTYLDFESPTWRARVGDFKTRQEADAAAAQIKGAFPDFAKEVRVVRDRINIIETNP